MIYCICNCILPFFVTATGYIVDNNEENKIDICNNYAIKNKQQKIITVKHENVFYTFFIR